MDRRHNRRRLVSLLLVLVAAVVVLGLLIGGLVDIPNASRPFQRSVNRSYADQAGVVARKSSQYAAELTKLLPIMPGLRRSQLQTQIDGLVSATSSDAVVAAQLGPPSPAASIAEDLVSAMTLRARAVVDLRSAVFGLLGMRPGVPPGVPAGATPSSRATASLSTTQADARLSAAAGLVRESDRRYAAFRSALRASVGHAVVPGSVWEAKSQLWTRGWMAGLAAALVAAPSLAADHRLVLPANSVRLTPASVPPAAQPASQSGAPAGASVVPPTRTLGVVATVDNNGNVEERGIVVSASLQPVQGGRTVSRSTKVSMDPGTAAAAVLPVLPVRAGNAYTLTVSVAAPPSQVDRGGLAASFSLWIAPSTPASSAAG